MFSMKIYFALCLLLFSSANGWESCQECIQDIGKAGGLIKGYENQIMDYLKENYCATQDIPDCVHIVETHHPKMLARHLCHHLGHCDDPNPPITCEVCISQIGKAKDNLTGEDKVAKTV